jgi:diguanylate cyclase (GGDEF)-like protein
VAVFSARLSAMRHQLRIQKKQLNQALEANLALVRQDSLTSLPNRRYAEELLQTEASRALRQPVSTCVCMIDIDHFKSINDTHGHAAGDQVLCLFAQCSSAMLRTIDVLARWGGEEFMLLMPLTKVDEAIKVLERMHSRFAQPEVWQSHPELKVTFSAGIAIHLAGEPISATLARADAAMYQAKLQGRNRTNHAA